MPSRYLLDTNTASYIIKGNVPRVRERLLKVPMSQVLIQEAFGIWEIPLASPPPAIGLHHSDHHDRVPLT